MPLPPAISTCPLVRSVAVCRLRARIIDPVAVKVPLPGSKISALAKPVLSPPATSTRPPLSSVAVQYDRAAVIGPADVNTPAAGS